MAKADAMVNQQGAENQDWTEFTQNFWEILAKCGAVIVLPGLIVIGFFYGLHAGVIAGAEKTLLLFKGLGRP
jgi:hypothetical protein